MERSGRLELERHGDKERPTARAALVHILALKGRAQQQQAGRWEMQMQMPGPAVSGLVWSCLVWVWFWTGFGSGTWVHPFLLTFIVSPPPWTLT